MGARFAGRQSKNSTARGGHAASGRSVTVRLGAAPRPMGPSHQRTGLRSHTSHRVRPVRAPT